MYCVITVHFHIADDMHVSLISFFRTVFHNGTTGFHKNFISIVVNFLNKPKTTKCSSDTIGVSRLEMSFTLSSKSSPDTLPVWCVESADGNCHKDQYSSLQILFVFKYLYNFKSQLVYLLKYGIPIFQQVKTGLAYICFMYNFT